MITPLTVVGDVHAGFAFAGGFGHGAIHVNTGQFEELRRLPSPDALADLVEDADEGGDVRRSKTSTEIAGRGRIGNALGTQGVELEFVLAAQFQILQTGAI